MGVENWKANSRPGGAKSGRKMQRSCNKTVENAGRTHEENCNHLFDRMKQDSTERSGCSAKEMRC